MKSTNLIIARLLQRTQHPKKMFASRKGRLIWAGLLVPLFGFAQDGRELIESTLKETATEEVKHNEQLASDAPMAMSNSRGKQNCCEEKTQPISSPCPAPPPCQPYLRECWTPRHGSITLDFLYFKGIEEQLKFAEKNPTTGINPEDTAVMLTGRYWPAGRARVSASIDDFWECAASWTFYYTNSGVRKAVGNTYSVFTSPTTPEPDTPGNCLCTEATAEWKMTLNSGDVTLSKPFCIGKSVMFHPSVGVQGFQNNQKIYALYENLAGEVNGAIIPDIAAQTPTTFVGHQRNWGAGPMASIETRFLARKKLDVFFRMGYAAMMGYYHAHIYYKNLLSAPGNATITFTNEGQRIFTYTQIQAALSKRWNVGQNGIFELAVGWETQFWTGQNRWEFFTNLSSAVAPGPLMIAGPFARLSGNF